MDRCLVVLNLNVIFMKINSMQCKITHQSQTPVELSRKFVLRIKYFIINYE